MSTLIPVENAQSAICAQLRPLAPETVSLLDAVGRVLAVDIPATLDQPPFTNAAMDGYAIRAEDVRNLPGPLPVDGVTAAGDGMVPPLRPGHARRIMTGAPLPDGADSVVPVELTTPGQGTVALHGAIQPGQHVRHRGEDLRAGALLLCAGHRIHALDVGALAGQGIAQISVTRRPRVGILATGDEVRPGGEALKPGQIYDANTPAVAALIREFGGEPVPFPIVRDEAAHLQAGLIQAGEAELDLLLTSAGVSMGDYDLVKQMLGELGTVEFWKVAIKPGKPLAFGSLRRTGTETPLPLIGLPGNPVAAVAACMVFVRPAIQTLLGEPVTPPFQITARLAEPLHNSGRRQFVRTRLTWDGTTYTAHTAGLAGSANVAGLAHSDGFIVIPEDVAELEVGDAVLVWAVRK